ncbi:MAG: SAM-dependent methyltransferase [Candidatus Hodarchaeaceae archaeon]|nr:SAM-dependent methyltransferase [Candidatus Hodarchaeaceae archaeon]
MFFIIEHLEPKMSEWLYIEYLHAARIVGRDKLLITNVRKKSEFYRLSKLARVERKRTRELFKQSELVVLDPRAKKKLSPAELKRKRAVVIGGILGEEPPLGRTKELLTKSLPRASARNIGKFQFAIDGAAYMAKQVSEGKSLKEVPVQHGLEVHISKGHSVLLPYAYPIVGGKPIISRQLIAYLKRPWPLGRR